MAYGRKPKEPMTRLLEKTVKTPNGCWLYQGHLVWGYGSIRIGSMKDGTRRKISTHRLSYEYHFGTIPDGLQVLHRCDVRNCVNPEHLFLGTQAQNVADMMAKGRQGNTGGWHVRSKIETATVDYIHRQRQAGRTLKEIADDTGFSFQHISRILNGKVKSINVQG